MRVVCGSAGGVAGPVTDIVIDPEHLDVTVGAEKAWTHPTTPGHTVFAYLFEGSARFGSAEDAVEAGTGVVVLLGDGDGARVEAGAQHAG